MFGKECSLCGGKLRNNVCTECGLDNSKNDSMYKGKINKSSCDGQPLTHVHEDPVVQPKPEKKVKMAKTFSYNAVDSGEAVKEKKPKKKAAQTISVVVAVLALLGPIFSLIGNLVDEFSASSWEVGIEEVGQPPSSKNAGDDDMYDYVEYALEETGVYWGADLTSGDYVVGVHIPEGTYRILANVGDCYLTVDDWNNGIYFWGQMAPEDMGLENSYYEVYDLRLYEGAVVKVEGYYPLWFETNNANQDDNPISNPLTEEVFFVNEESKVAGVDFPAGTYDVVAEPGGGYLEFETPVPEDQEYADYYIGSIWLHDENGGDTRYYNLVIPEGVKVSLYGFTEGDSVMLRPSAVISTEDYEGYYLGTY